MSEDRINLKKQVGIVLTKRNIPNLCVQVAVGLDVSGSTKKLFERGVFQQSLDRTFAIADKVDDNHTLDSWVFSNKVAEAPAITVGVLDNYTNNQIVNSTDSAIRKALWGGTEYGGVISAMVEHYRPGMTTGLKAKIASFFKPKAVKKMDPPAFAMIYTDGDNDDKEETLELLKVIEDSNVFIQWVGVGTEKFAFLKKTATQFSNVDFVDIHDLEKIDSEAMFEKIITPKFASWVKKVSPEHAS